jgi:hypothetical protein
MPFCVDYVIIGMKEGGCVGKDVGKKAIKRLVKMP